ncbi:MAG: DivIVA domain-containing protein [Bacteroidota bacterium]
MLTPIEIRQQTFNREFRGYDKVEVDAFLQEVSKALELQLEANRKLKEELDKVQSNYNTLKQVENMLHKTLMQAEVSSKTTLENAREKAELKMMEAEAKARDIVQSGISERKKVDTDILELMDTRDEIMTQLKVFLNTQINRLSGIEDRMKLEAPKAPQNGVSHSINDIFDKPDHSSHANGKANGQSAKSLIEDIADEL